MTSNKPIHPTPKSGAADGRRWTAKMKCRAILTITALLLCVRAHADTPFASTEELQKWLTYYYLDPRPELAVRSLTVMDAAMREHKNRSLADEVSRGGLRSFYARILENNGAVVDELSTSLDSFPPEMQNFGREILRRCQSSACAKALGNNANETEPDQSVGVDTLDDYWASFMATGDTRYVNEVIKALPLIEVRGDTGRMLVGGAARWSLMSNAYQHSRVMAACEMAYISADDVTKRLLKEIIADAKAELAKNPISEPKPQ